MDKAIKLDQKTLYALGRSIIRVFQKKRRPFRRYHKTKTICAICMKGSRIVQHKICAQIKKPLHSQSVFILCNTRVSLHFKKLKLTRSQKDQFFYKSLFHYLNLKVASNHH